jgi:DNA-binding transcriptional LysR family regulator
MKNLQGLVSFVESASAGSFTDDVRLFNRTTRRLTLSAEGAAFAEQAREALRALDDAVAGVSRAGGEVAGRVRISVGMAFGRHHVLPLLPQLAQVHPKLQLEVSLDNRAVDLVAEGFDIGVRGGVIRDSSLIARPVCKLPLVLLASPDYLKRTGVPLQPADLAQHELLAVRNASGPLGSSLGVWHFRKPSGRGLINFEPAARLWSNDPEAMVDLALAGAGICQSGLHHAVPYLREGRLKLVLADQHHPGDREVVLHYPHRQFLPARVRVVVEALLLHLAQQPALHHTPATIDRAWCASARTRSTAPKARPRR